MILEDFIPPRVPNEKTGLLVIVCLCLLFTLFCFIGAIQRKRELKAAGVNSDRERYANRMLRHEFFRAVKSALIVLLIWMTPADPPPLASVRNVIITAIGVMIGLNSAFDLYDRYTGLRGFLRAKREPDGVPETE